MFNIDCDDSDLTLEKVLEEFDQINNMLFRLLKGGLSVIQKIAMAREISKKLKDLREFSTGITAKFIICGILKNLDIDLSAAEQEMAEYNAVFESTFETDVIDLDKALGSNDPMGEIDRQIDAFFNSQMQRVEKEVEDVKEQLRNQLYLLTAIGSTEAEIDAALEEVEYQDDIKEYFLNIFKSLANKAVSRLD